ncbi:MAG: dTDP-4-dehydrorhamnose 3,5-epimerase [Anaerolineaceae bacterium]
MIKSNTELTDVFVIEPVVFKDARGFFMEAFHQQKINEFGIPYTFVQDNQSLSTKGTLRGLHYQVSHIQGKLMRVLRGAIYDVAVDLRKSSATFGKWAGIELSAENKKQLWIPPCFAHGFYVLSDQAEVLYKTTDYYDAGGERCILWNDPDLGITWPLDPDVPLLLSNKDQKGVSFKQAEVFK